MVVFLRFKAQSVRLQDGLSQLPEHKLSQKKIYIHWIQFVLLAKISKLLYNSFTNVKMSLMKRRPSHKTWNKLTPIFSLWMKTL